MAIKLEELIGAIHTSLADNPNWLGDVIGAVNSGAQEALNRAAMSRAKVDIAFLSALGMAMPGKRSKGEVDAFTKTILDAIDRSNMCELERKFVEQHAKVLKNAP
jgi:hypothetical protein